MTGRWDVPNPKLARIAAASPAVRECAGCRHIHPKGERCGYPLFEYSGALPVRVVIERSTSAVPIECIDPAERGLRILAEMLEEAARVPTLRVVAGDREEGTGDGSD